MNYLKEMRAIFYGKTDHDDFNSKFDLDRLIENLSFMIFFETKRKQV